MSDVLRWSNEDLEELYSRKWHGRERDSVVIRAEAASSVFISRLIPLASYVRRFLGHREDTHSV
jgi:hypothetical protein